MAGAADVRSAVHGVTTCGGAGVTYTAGWRSPAPRPGCSSLLTAPQPLRHNHHQPPLLLLLLLLLFTKKAWRDVWRCSRLGLRESGRDRRGLSPHTAPQPQLVTPQ